MVRRNDRNMINVLPFVLDLVVSVSIVGVVVMLTETSVYPKPVVNLGSWEKCEPIDATGINQLGFASSGRLCREQASLFVRACLPVFVRVAVK